MVVQTCLVDLAIINSVGKKSRLVEMSFYYHKISLSVSKLIYEVQPIPTYNGVLKLSNAPIAAEAIRV